MAALAEGQTSETSTKQIEQMESTIKGMNIPFMSSFRPTKRTHDDGQTDKSSKRQHRGSEGDKMHDAITNAGYTLAWHHLPQDGKDVIVPLYSVRYYLCVV